MGWHFGPAFWIILTWIVLFVLWDWASKERMRRIARPIVLLCLGLAIRVKVIR